jgi:hypothetical protein
LLWFVGTVNVCLEEGMLVAGTKQSRQAYKAGRLTRQLGLLALFCAHY